MPPKKRRNDQSSTSATPPASSTPDPETWPGWCEIESEPAFFNTILHDMGVRGLRVHEVFGVDDVALAVLPKPVHAVIFLFRYKEDATEKAQETVCPSHVWFANQVPHYACGTVALLNIVNNIPDLELGKKLQSFKAFTQSFDPVARGHAIDTFDFVRNIHNSFARETDMLAVDSLLKEKSAMAAKRRKTEAATAARVAKAAERAAERAAKADSDPSKVRSNPPRKTRTSKSTAEEPDEIPEDEGFHFVAYMPIADEVWKLDGLDRFPTSLGKVPEDQDWLNVIQTTLSVRMAEYEEGQMQFSLMAVVQDPVIADRYTLAQNVRSLQEIEIRLNEVCQDWRGFIAPCSEEGVIFDMSDEYGLTKEMIAEALLTEKTAQQLMTACPENLLKTRQELITNQAGHRAAVRDSQQAEITDAEESMHRRHDYGAFVKSWMQALVENGTLKSLLENDQG